MNENFPSSKQPIKRPLLRTNFHHTSKHKVIISREMAYTQAGNVNHL